MKKIGITCLLFMLLFFNNAFSSFAYNDYDGNGVISKDEKERWAQEAGFSSHREMMETMADPEKWEQFVQSHGGIEGSGESTTSKISKEDDRTHVHSYTATVTKDATCTEAGEMTYKCSCGDSYTEAIPMKPHDYETTVTKEPTCTEAGTQAQVCKDCGDTIETTIPALGHKAGDWVTEKEPTCSEEGRNVRYCTVCGEAVETMMVDKLPHTEGEWEVAQKPTLTKTGLKVVKCTECDEILKEEVIPANTALLYVLIGAGGLSLIGISAGIVRYKCKH